MSREIHKNCDDTNVVFHERYNKWRCLRKFIHVRGCRFHFSHTSPRNVRVYIRAYPGDSLRGETCLSIAWQRGLRLDNIIGGSICRSSIQRYLPVPVLSFSLCVSHSFFHFVFLRSFIFSSIPSPPPAQGL